MKRNAEFLAFLSLVLGVTPSFAALKPGDIAPDFKTQASLAGEEFTFSLRDALKKGASDEKGEIAKSYDIEIADTYKGQAVATMKDSRGNEIGHRMAERDPRGYPGRSCHPPPSAEYRCTNALKLFS
jgi:hypothetical protein